MKFGGWVEGLPRQQYIISNNTHNVMNTDIQSRREFFKNAAKAALPVLGLAIVSSIPSVSSNARESPMTSCIFGCSGSCSGGCENSCYGTCSNGCYKSCSRGCTEVCGGGCGSQCQSDCNTTCKGECFGNCSNSCFGCKGTCRNTCSGDCSGSQQIPFNWPF